MVEVTINVDTNSLKWLLTLAQRKQTIDGSSHAQLYSVILKASDGRLSLTSLVKDGVTSLMRLSIPCTGRGEVVITDIDTTLGVLKYHGGVITITPTVDKVKFKSSNKQTTLSASKEAKAFPHTPETMAQWDEKSSNIAVKINADEVTYTNNQGTIYEPVVSLPDLNSTTLYEAFRCDSMNSQKFNKYTLAWRGDGLSITVGEELKGKTTTVIETTPMVSSGKSIDSIPVDIKYNGGLEHIFANLNNDVGMWVFDFSEVGMGYPLLITLGDGDYIFQMSNEG